jgi:dTDP-glucose 4,6-dehydratase
MASQLKYKRLLVTGGAGFIGSAFIRFALGHNPELEKIVNLDKLTYAANLESLSAIEGDERYFFSQGDVGDSALVERLCLEHAIDAIVHFAAVSHVDRSITGPLSFFETNVRGTLALLEIVRRHPHLHFHQISTDEVYGSLSQSAPPFSEESRYEPNSPYSASKAAADHFVRAYAHTYGLSTTLSHCGNNYGPFQHPEKFIPLMVTNCLQKKALPLYGNGENVRDWIFVDDHVEAVWLILQRGKKGEVYDIGSRCERRNRDLLRDIIRHVSIASGEEEEELLRLITSVPDRPGHDFRYAIDCSKVRRELDWQPRFDLEKGLKTTVDSILCSEQKKLPASSLHA